MKKCPTAELDAARHSVVARFALSLESPQQLIGYAITRKTYNFPADYWDKYPAQIAAITADDVQRVAKKYINPGDDAGRRRRRRKQDQDGPREIRPGRNGGRVR